MDTSPLVLNKQKILRRIAVVGRINAQIVSLLEGVPDPDRNSLRAMDVLLGFMARPGGFLRTRKELAEATGIKPRTLAWAVGKARKRGLLVRREDARWSRTGDWEAYDALSGVERVDAYVLNELQYRFQNRAEEGARQGYTFGMMGLVDVGGRTALNQSLTRLAKVGHFTLKDGEVVPPTGLATIMAPEPEVTEEKFVL